MLKNKGALIIILTFAALILCLAGCKKPEGSNESLNPEYISGSYALSINNAGSSLYEFENDGTGSLAYSNSDGDVINETFTYEIKGELGSRKITFVWNERRETTTHSFASGSEDGFETIYINDEVYRKIEE
jgi:hypothetical protein